MVAFFLRRFGALMALGVLSLFLQACSPEVALPHVSLEQARAELEAGKVLMIDIREPQEHATGVAQGVVLLPTSQVAKRVADGQTVSRVERLDDAARVDEIARMLGGVRITATTRQHADELLRQAREDAAAD
jgi:hypothetical protein